MKKLSFLVIIIIVLAASCKKDSDALPKLVHNDIIVEQIQMPLLMKMTGTNCHACGTWGWDLFHKVSDSIGNQINYLGVYARANSVFNLPEANTLQDEFAPLAGTPAFVLNGENVTQYQGSSILVENTEEKIFQLAFSTKNLKPIIGCALKYNIDDNIEIRLRVEAFEELDGDYYVAVYIVENGVPGEQSGRLDSPYSKHAYVLQHTVNASAWGELISKGKLSPNDKFDFTYAVQLNTSWAKTNTKPLAIIWEKTSVGYKFVNSSK